jgi:hypothetical protein
MSFAVSISLLTLVQAALVALPVARPLPERLTRLGGHWWALAPALSIAVVIAAIELSASSATGFTYLALFAVPPLAAVALARLVHGVRPSWALAVPLLFAIAWVLPEALAGETAALALSALSCVTLGWLLVGAVPSRWLRWGVYAMAALDAVLVGAEVLQGPSDVLSAAAPIADLPRLQVANFGTARMGFGDLFVAALVGCLLAQCRSRQLEAALLTAALALAFDLLFFTLDTLPGTVPVAAALALISWRAGAGLSR